ncbi:MAG: hypothetical protein COZ66_00045, partial [Candidatus Huberarchaeum crystalense]
KVNENVTNATVINNTATADANNALVHNVNTTPALTTVLVLPSINITDTVMKVCTPPTVLAGGEVNCTIAYLHVGTADVKNITITDYLPDGFRYLNVSVLTDINEILNSTNLSLPELPLGLNASDLVKLAEGPTQEPWATPCTNDSEIKFGKWNMTANDTGAGVKISVGLVGIKITLRASSNLTDATTTFQNNATVEANETNGNSINASGSGNIIVSKVNATDVFVKKCVPIVMIGGQEEEGGILNCVLFYTHVGTKDVKNITITDYMPENFTYINVTEITNVSEILQQTGAGDLSATLDVLNVTVKTADGPDKSLWPSCGNKGNITFGKWNITAQDAAGAAGAGKISVGVIGLNITMKAPVNLTNATNTTVNIAGIGYVNATFQNFTNKASVNITEVDEFCGESVSYSYDVNETVTISAIKLALPLGGTLLKECPAPTIAGEDITCTVAYLYIGVSPLKNITITDYLPEGFSYTNATWVNNITEAIEAIKSAPVNFPPQIKMNDAITMASKTGNEPWPDCGDKDNISFGTWDVTGETAWNNSATGGAGTIYTGLVVLNITLRTPTNISQGTSISPVGGLDTVQYQNNVSSTGYKTVKEMCGGEVNKSVNASGSGNITIVKINNTDTLVKTCQTPTTSGGEVDCTIAYLHIGTADVRNITLIDYLPPGFQYINATEINVSEILALTGLLSVGNTSIDASSVSLANRTKEDQPNCSDNGTIQFGTWEINKTTSISLGTLNVNLAVGVVGLKVKLRAPSDLSQGTPIAPIGGLDAMQYQNNVTVNATETAMMCGNETVINNISQNASGNISVVKINTTDTLVKTCPTPTTAGGEVECTIAYLHIGVSELRNITLTDTLPIGFKFIEAKVMNNATEILNSVGNVPSVSGVEPNVSLAGFRNESWPNFGESGTIKFGVWEMNKTASINITGVGNVNLVAGVVGLKVKLRAPTDLSNGTPIGQVQGFPAFRYKNNVTVNATEVAIMCEIENPINEISKNTTENITVLNVSTNDTIIKVCAPPATSPNGEVSCVIAYLHAGTETVENISIMDILPDGFKYKNYTVMNDSSQILAITGLKLPDVPSLPVDIFATRTETNEPDENATGNISFGTWKIEKNETTNLAIGLVALNVTLKASSEAGIYTNKVESQTNGSTIANNSATILVQGPLMIKTCTPQFAGQNMTCLIAAINIGLNDTHNVT